MTFFNLPRGEEGDLAQTGFYASHNGNSNSCLGHKLYSKDAHTVACHRPQPALIRLDVSPQDPDSPEPVHNFLRVFTLN